MQRASRPFYPDTTWPYTDGMPAVVAYRRRFPAALRRAGVFAHTNQRRLAWFGTMSWPRARQGQQARRLSGEDRPARCADSRQSLCLWRSRSWCRRWRLRLTPRPATARRRRHPPPGRRRARGHRRRKEHRRRKKKAHPRQRPHLLRPALLRPALRGQPRPQQEARKQHCLSRASTCGGRSRLACS